MYTPPRYPIANANSDAELLAAILHLETQMARYQHQMAALFVTLALAILALAGAIIVLIA